EMRNAMFDYGQEIERRILQFAGFLKKMYQRSHEEVEGSCFHIFEEQAPNNAESNKALVEAAKPALELIVAGFDDAGIASLTLTEDSPPIDLPDAGWKADDSQNRFIQ